MARKSTPIPALDFFRGFEAAARHMSFTKAAEELFITQSAVSRQIQGNNAEREYPTEDMQPTYNAVDTLNKEMQTAGTWVFAGGLHPSRTATVVRAKDGEVLTTDGPYTEGKEQIGGFWVIQAANLDDALAWARKATVACGAPVELRPFQDEPEG